jgi:hypothetical protein
VNLRRRAILSLPLCAVVSAHASRLGRCRGTGVLRRVGGVWKIEQYHLAIPIPNALADEGVKRIRAGK